MGCQSANKKKDLISCKCLCCYIVAFVIFLTVVIFSIVMFATYPTNNSLSNNTEPDYNSTMRQLEVNHYEAAKNRSIRVTIDSIRAGTTEPNVNTNTTQAINLANHIPTNESRSGNIGTVGSPPNNGNGLNIKGNPTMPDSSNLKKGIPKLDQDSGNVMSTEKAIKPKAGIVSWIKSKANNGDEANIDELKMKPKDMGMNFANVIVSTLDNSKEENVEYKPKNLPKFEVNSDLGTENEEDGNYDEDNR